MTKIFMYAIFFISVFLIGCSQEKKPLHGIYMGQTDGSDFALAFLDKTPREAILLVNTPGLLSQKEQVFRIPVTYKEGNLVMEVDVFSYRYKISDDKAFLSCTGECRRYPKEFSLQKMQNIQDVENMYNEMLAEANKK